MSGKRMVDWRKTKISAGGTHHVFNNEPFYEERFDNVLKFHYPGLAAVQKEEEGFHIEITGRSIYPERYIRTFGFYQERAAVQANNGWFHVLPDGQSLYERRFAWVGNFQYDRCVVRLETRDYSHIDLSGSYRIRKNLCICWGF